MTESSIDPAPELDRDQLKEHVRQNALDIGRPCEACNGDGTVYPGHRVIHTRMGGFGADWDESDVLDAIDNAVEVQWQRGLFGAYLAVIAPNGEAVAVELPHPEDAAPPAR